jgi:PhoH-like ATPase
LSKKKHYYDNETYNVARENKITFKDNPEQKELSRLIKDNDTKVIFCDGNAGTGKTFTSLYVAYQLVKEKKYEKILFSRDPVQLGEDMGFLPGGVDEKFNPFMSCLFDNLENIQRLGGPTIPEMKSKIELTPIAFLRGRSIEQAILIVDEAQNLDLVTLKAILTRVGQYCKVILLGSLNQIDNKHQAKKDKCDFQRVRECLEEFPFVGSVTLIQSKRSEICSLIDEKLKDLK